MNKQNLILSLTQTVNELDKIIPTLLDEENWGQYEDLRDQITSFLEEYFTYIELNQR